MKKRTGKWISLSLATALAFTAAPVTALADQQPTETVETTDTNLGDEETTEDAQPVADTGKTEIDESAERTEETKETEETEGTDTDQVPGTPVEEENTEEEDLPGTVIPEAVTPLAEKIIDAETLQAALDEAADAEDLAGKTVTLTQNISIENTTINVPEGVTLTADSDVTITVANTKDPAFTLSNNATLDRLHIQSTADSRDNSVSVNLVSIGNSNAKVTSCHFIGNYRDGHEGVTRAIAVSPGVTDFEITGNTIKNLRQPAYVEGNGTITDNNVSGTRGWVICANYSPTLKDNTFENNIVDIAIISNNATESNFSTKIAALSEANNGAYVEDQIITASAKNGNYYVNAGSRYATLAGALKDAGDGDTIVLNGDLGALNITGVDKKITITGGENYSFDVLNILNSQGITLKDLTFKKVSTAGNGDTNPAALYVQNSSNIAVENCIFDGSDIGSDISGTPCAITTAAGVTNFSVENSTIRNFTMSSYHNPGGITISYTGNTIENSSSGIAFVGVKGVTIEENTFDNANGIRLYPDYSNADSKCESITITENSFTSIPADGYAVKLADSTGRAGVDSVDLSGNYWDGANANTIQNLIDYGTLDEDSKPTTTIDTYYATSADKESGSATVITQETGIKINGKWYQDADAIKTLIKAGIPDGATIEVYGEVNIPFQANGSFEGTALPTEGIVDGYFVVTADNVTIKGMTDDATLYSTDKTINGNWGSQSFLLFTGDNVTLEDLTILPHSLTDGGTNKTVEFAGGGDVTVTNCTILKNNKVDPATEDGGSLYFNGDKGTVLVQDCTFDATCVVFDSVDSADSITIEDNTFTTPVDPYTIGNVSWTTPVTTSMADVTIEGNTFKGLTEDTTLVRQRMDGNFILTDNTTNLGPVTADMILFQPEAIHGTTPSKMHVTIADNGQTVVLTAGSTNSEEPTTRTFALDRTSVSIRVNRTVTLTAGFSDDTKITDGSVAWSVDGTTVAENGNASYDFKPTARGTYTVTASYTDSTTNITYTASCTVRATSSSGGGSSSSSSYDGYVSVDNSKNGDVSISDSRADEDDTITITTKPDNGYVVDKVVVEDEDGDKLDVTEKSDNKYTFEMPNGDVTVTVTFKEDTSSDEEEEETKDEETTDETALGFLDVSRNDWFYSAVEYVVNHDVMSGVSDSSFAPNATLTRGMLVQILYNLEDRPDNNGINIFTDVTTDAWYTDAVIWANNENIVSGMGEGIFAPNAEITREQMALMLYNYAQCKGYDVSASAELSAFTDGADVSSWASHAVQWAVAEGLMSGMGNGTLAPQGTATRAEVSSIMMRFMENI